MSVDPRCERTDLPASMCSHCRGHDDRPVGSDQLTAFEARFPGRCDNCDGAIRVGDVIAPLRDGAGYVCTGCLP